MYGDHQRRSIRDFRRPRGYRIHLNRGDLVIIPAGVGHRCTKSSSDFICVGAYPGRVNYDTCYGLKEELAEARKRIKKLSVPSQDPLLGKPGILKSRWKNHL